MALPSGISTCTVTVGSAVDFFGGNASISVQVRPVLGGNAKRITWAATGQPLTSFSGIFTGEAGAPATFTLPHVDQAGFKDGAGNAFSGWSYLATVTITNPNTGETVTYDQAFQIFAGQTTVDLDLVPDGTIGSPTSAPSAAVTSVNGQTGAAVVGLGDVAATATTAGALVVGKTNPVDASAGPLTMTLAAASGAGRDVVVSKVDASANVVTISVANLRGSAGTLTLVGQYETLRLSSKADGSWWVVGDHRTKTWFDATYRTRELSNIATGSFDKFRLALARTRAGLADAKILCVGDSTTGGFGGNGASGFVGDANSYPARLAGLLNVRVPTSQGLGIPPSALGTSVDSRWTVGSGWIREAFGFGGNATYAAPAGTVAALTYAPGVLADRVDIYILANNNPNLGTFDAKFGDGTKVSISTTGTPGTTKVTVSAATASSAHSLVIDNVTIAKVRIVGIEPWLSTGSRVRVGNAGVGGAKTSDWVADGTNFGGPPAIRAYAPHLTIISLGINDAGSALSVSAYAANLQTLITAARVSGDVILMSPFPSASSAASAYLTNEVLYNQILPTLGAPWVDLHGRFYAPGSAANAPFMFDSLHPNGAGYADLAMHLARVLESI